MPNASLQINTHNMLNVKYSIIIPVYNAEQHLDQCINSLLNQTINNFEIIIVNDGSTDSSPQLCQQFADADQRINIINQNNQGPSAARNTALQKATGDYILFVDADDWVETNYLSTIDNTLHNNPNIDLLFFSEIRHFHDGCINIFSSGENTLYTKKDIQNEIIRLIQNASKHPYFGFTWNKVFRRSIITQNNIRFNEQLRTREDEVFSMTYAMHITSLKTIFAPIYNYRISPTSLTQTKKQPEEYFYYANAIVNAIQDNGLNVLKHFIAKKATFSLVRGLAQTANPFNFIRYFPKTIKFCHKNKVGFPYYYYSAYFAKSFLGK